MANLVTVEVPVKVKAVIVTETFDPKYKTKVPNEIKPQIEKGISKIKVQIPKGKQLGAFAVDVSVTVKKTDKGIQVEVKIVPSEDNNILGGATGSGTVPKEAKIEDADVSAAAAAAAREAVKSAIAVFNEKAKKP